MRFRAILTVTVCVLASAVRAEPASETGFTPLFTGTNLDGWKMQKGGEALTGKTEAYRKRFVVAAGELIIDEKLKGNAIIETEKTFSGDLTLRFEYKPGKGCNNDLYIQGIKFDLKTQSVPNLKIDEWNTFEIVIAGGKARIGNNGEQITTVKAKPGATPFAIRAEFGPVRFRNIRMKTGN
jgi:hypothetical protein